MTTSSTPRPPQRAATEGRKFIERHRFFAVRLGDSGWYFAEWLRWPNQKDDRKARARAVNPLLRGYTLRKFDGSGFNAIVRLQDGQDTVVDIAFTWQALVERRHLDRPRQCNITWYSLSHSCSIRNLCRPSRSVRPC